jgi:hypothetical protein
MRIPQTPDRLKEAPVHVLRAMFAGVGQVLLLPGRVLRRGESGSAATAVLDAEPATVPAPRPAEPEASPAAAPAAATAAAEAVREKIAERPEPAAELPVPGYPDLTIASLRARMRGLDVGQLNELLDYERAHDARENVITMFERRVAKLRAEGSAAS